MKLNTFIKYVRRFPDIRMNSNCVTLYMPYFCKADPIENKYIKCFDTKYIRNLFYCSDIADGPMRHFTAYDSDTIDNCSLQLKKATPGNPCAAENPDSGTGSSGAAGSHMQFQKAFSAVCQCFPFIMFIPHFRKSKHKIEELKILD